MATLLFSLRGVPDDEAEEVRALLHEQGIDFYETGAGNWGMSMPAIWLKNDADLPQARTVLNAYQAERTAIQRQRYVEAKQQGLEPGFFEYNRRHPWRFLFYITLLAAILYVSVGLVLQLGLRIGL